MRTWQPASIMASISSGNSLMASARLKTPTVVTLKAPAVHLAARLALTGVISEVPPPPSPLWQRAHHSWHPLPRVQQGNTRFHVTRTLAPRTHVA